jgi:hypothetical protein
MLYMKTKKKKKTVVEVHQLRLYEMVDEPEIRCTFKLPSSTSPLLVPIHHANTLHLQRNHPLKLLSVETSTVGQAPQTLNLSGDVLPHGILDV